MKGVITLAALCLLAASCSMRVSEPVLGDTFTPSNAEVLRGEQVYMAACQKCHPAGEAGLGPSVTANPAPQFLKRFQMRHGLGVMPGFTREEISRSDLRAISAYLKAWKR